MADDGKQWKRCGIIAAAVIVLPSGAASGRSPSAAVSQPQNGTDALPPKAVTTIQDALDVLNGRKRGRPAPPEPHGEPTQFFSSDDYPPEAIRAGQQGRVTVKLWVDDHGKVASCTVTGSSGSPSLDRTTCDISLARISYQPAVDRRGRPVAGATSFSVRWMLPSGPVDVDRAPIPEWKADMTMSIDAAGKVVACNGTFEPASPGADPCRAYPVGKETDYRWQRNGRAVGAIITRRASEKVVVDP